MFIVVEHGVYKQRLFGLFDTLAEASEAAKEQAQKDADTHHDWEVYQLADDGEWEYSEIYFNRDRTPRSFK